MLRMKLIKTGAKVVHHARYVIFQMAELWVSTNLLCAMLSRHSAVKRGNFSAIVVAGRAFTRAETRQNALVEVAKRRCHVVGRLETVSGQGSSGKSQHK